LVWTDEKDKYFYKARDRGYTVILAKSDKVKRALKELGVKDIESIRHLLKERSRVRGALTEKERRLLESSKSYLSIIDSAFEEGLKKIKEEKYGRGREVIENLEKELKEVDSKSMNEVIKELERRKPDIDVDLRGTVKVGGIVIGIAEHPDEDVEAFQYGDIIALNLNNPFVKKCVERERFDLLIPTIIHEYVHFLGIREHNEDFVTLYNFVEEKFREWELENELFTLRKISGREDNKYLRIKIGKRILGDHEKFKVGDTVEVLIRKVKE